MTVCKIFSTYLATTRADTEIDALVDEFESLISATDGFSIGATKSEASDDKIYRGYRYYTRYCKLTMRGDRGKPRSRWLALHFDLVRDIAPSKSVEWAHARDALLVVAYASALNDRWEPKHLLVASSGRFEDDEAWESVRGSTFADKRFLVWKDKDTRSEWSERAWVFAVPLRSIEDSEAISKQLVAPVVSLLRGKQPEVALKTSNAIKWGN